MLVAISCNSFKAVGGKDVLSIGEPPRWAYDLLDERKRDDIFEELKSQKSRGNKDPWVLMGLGRIYALKKHYNLSLSSYKKVLEDYPHLPEAKIEMASIYYHQNKLTKSLELLSTLGDTNSSLMFDKALVYFKMGEEARSLENINACISLGNTTCEAMEFKAMLLLKTRYYHKAKKMLQRLHLDFPHNTFAIKNLFWMEHSKGDLRNRDSLIKELRQLETHWSSSTAGVIDSMRGYFPYPPESDFHFRDWFGRPWKLGREQ